MKQLGADHVVWASDFPHPDAEFPGAVAEFCEHSASHRSASDQTDLDDLELDTIFWTTPLRFYRLEERFISTV